MGQLRERMETDLILAGYSPSTRKIYLLYARLFAKHHGRSPAEMGEPEIRAYLLYMVEDRKISRETYRQIRAALMFLYTVCACRCTDAVAALILNISTLPRVALGTCVCAHVWKRLVS